MRCVTWSCPKLVEISTDSTAGFTPNSRDLVATSSNLFSRRTDQVDVGSASASAMATAAPTHAPPPVMTVVWSSSEPNLNISSPAF